jgi:hypothetical protein
MLMQRLDGALGQHRAEAEGHVRGVDHLEHRQFHGFGEALAAVGRVGGERVPAIGHEGAVGVGEAGGCGHDAVLVARALGVALAVQRRQHVSRERARRLQHRGHGVGVQLRIGPGDQGVVPHRLQREGQVADGRAEGHGLGLRFLAGVLGHGAGASNTPPALRPDEPRRRPGE